jgi:hypothetical protein
VPGPPGETQEEAKERKARKAARAAITRRFANVPPNVYVAETREKLRLAFIGLGLAVDELMPEGSDKRLVLNMLEDLLPRAIRGVDRQVIYTPEMLAQLDAESVHDPFEEPPPMRRSPRPDPPGTHPI